MKRYYIYWAAAISLASPTAVFAYDDLSGGWAVPSLDTAISISNDVMNQTIIREVVAKEARSKRQPNSDIKNLRGSEFQNESIVKTAQQMASLNFMPSMARRKQNLTQFINKTRLGNPEGASQMAKLFASADVIGLIGNGIAPFGLRVDNVADAYTVYWTNAWLGSRGRSDTLTQQQISGVKNQAVNALLAIPAFTSASDAQKQELAEAMLVQAAMIESYIGNAKSDPALMSKVKAAIAQGGKRMGLDLYAMTLTPNGFVPAKKGSAVDDGDLAPSVDAEEQALASPTSPAEKEPLNLALIAAAGGAGLGGMFLLGKAMGRKS